MKCDCRLKNVLIVYIACMIFSGLAACSDKSNGVINKELSQQGKPTAPITISYVIPERAAVGETLNITVEFKTLSDVAGLSLKLTAGEGLRMTPEQFEVDYRNQSANSTFTQLVTVTPESEGILYLNVFVAGTFNGKKMVRTGAIPISVGSDARKSLKKPDKVIKDSEGRQIIIMPAEEENR